MDAAASGHSHQAERSRLHSRNHITFNVFCSRITDMPNIDRIEGFADELTAIRRDLHAHPEIGFEEVRTSGIVADKLTQWGIEVHRGLGGTGVVGVLKGKGTGGKRIGLRADMDALHNAPDLNHGEIAILPGPAMAGADFFDIVITGYGAHGAMPNYAKDPIIIAMTVGQALQSIVSRNVNPHEPAVLSITQIHAGSAYNVIPSEAKLCGTVRAFSDEVRVLIRERMRAICAGIAGAFQVEIAVDIRDGFSVLVNQEEQSNVVAEVARTVVDPSKVITRSQPKMGSEDFADMLHAVPGAYFWVGHEGSVPVHNPGYILDDKILPIGASMFARIIETRLPVSAHA